MNGLAGVVKKNSSTSGEAASGGIFFYHNCQAMNGEKLWRAQELEWVMEFLDAVSKISEIFA